MRWLLHLTLPLLLAFGLAGAPAHADAGDIARRLGRGVNILGYDPLWWEPAKARFTMAHFAQIKAGGFQHVRVNLHAFDYLDGQNRLKPRFLETLDRIVDEATRAGLMVIIDEHDFQPCGKDVETCTRKLVTVWEQLAGRYAGAPDSVVFEILNEPNGHLTQELWNALLARVLGVIRRLNSARAVIVGPGNYNHHKALDKLVLPDGDPNVIVTVHYYDPFRFTHQGATWTDPSRETDIGIPWGTPEERAKVEADMDAIAAWSRERGRPVMIGEFGVFDAAEMEARAAWTSAVARAAEARGFPWGYWQFEGTFGVFDIKEGRWVAPIHEALVPR